MLIFPAIDLIGGEVVRLFQGDYTQQQTFGSDPTAFAKEFEQAGATHLHLVDLDGAKQGAPRNVTAIRSITEKTGLFVELGGGIRNEESVENAFEMGVKRVILGTAALQNTAFTKRMVRKYGGGIAVGVDARDGKVAIEGWLSTSGTDSVEFCLKMRDIGVEYIIYTDISRDGAGQGTNLDIYQKLSGIDGLNITASGGVSFLEDIVALRRMNLYAAIVGKALYTGEIGLNEALQTARKEEKEGAL